MDEDGFYMGELDGIRGLVPSNFLAESDGHNQGGPTASSVAQRSLNNRGRGGMMSGPGARGPPPPPRDNMMGGMGPRKGMNKCCQIIVKSLIFELLPKKY